jgi:hypothetical protein
MNRARYIQLTSSAPVAASFTTYDYLVHETAVLTAINSAGSRSDLVFSHVLSGVAPDADWTTDIEIINTGSATATLTLTFNTQEAGVKTAQRTLMAGGALRQSVQELFGVTNAFQSGWVRVSSGEPIVGAAVYADRLHSGCAAVPAQTSAQTTLLFAHIADLAPWYTGIALLNATDTPANVEVFGFNSDGSPIGGATAAQARFTLPAGARTAKVLGEWIPATQQRAADGGFVLIRTTNDVPLYGLELFFLRNLTVLANVPAQIVEPRVSFLFPPNPGVLPNTYNVSVRVIGSYGGTVGSTDGRIVCFKSQLSDVNYPGPNADCQATYSPPIPIVGGGPPVFARVTLRALGGIEYGVFDGWGGDCSQFGVQDTCTLTVNRNMNVTGSYSSTAPVIIVKPPPPRSGGGSGGSGGSGSGNTGGSPGSGRPGSIYLAFAVSAGFNANGGWGLAMGTNLNSTIGAANNACRNSSGTFCGDVGYCLGNPPSGRWAAFATDRKPDGAYAWGCGYASQAAAISSVLNRCTNILTQCSVVWSGFVQ